MRWIALILTLCGTSTWAEGFPASFFVKDVASDDALNIRSEPNAGAEIIGEYSPYALNIEVLRTTTDGKWGLVGVGERNGWTSMRYLARSDHQDADNFPRPMRCFGAEPFWSLNVTARGDEYTDISTERRDLEMTLERAAENGAMAVFKEGPTLDRTLIVKRGYCSDGMSDREFGWQAMLFNDAPDGPEVQSGCCTLDGQN